MQELIVGLIMGVTCGYTWVKVEWKDKFNEWR